MPMAAHAPAGLELVNFRDPSQRTGDAKAPDAAVASAAAPGSGRNVWIGAGLAAALVIGAGVFLMMRTRPATPAAAAPSQAPAAPVPTAPIVFPAPQVGKDAVKDTANKPASVSANKAAPAPAPPPKVEKAEEKTASRKAEAPKPEPKAKSFKVQFSSIPMATLFVDGKKIGPSLPAQVIELPQGKHTLRFENPDLPPYEKQFAVGSDGAPPIAYRFPVGAIVVNAPAWAGANVLIDSKFKGILVGEKSFQVTAGPHKVTLSREGVNPHTEEVNVSDGEKKTVAPPAPTSTKESS